MNQAPVVLIVDDDPSVSTAIRRLLRSAGYQVHAFENTKGLLARGRPDGPCCLILDVRLQGEDGLKFHEQLMRSEARLPVVFLSGHGDVATSVRAIKAGAVDFLLKPFDANKLLDVVAVAIKSDAQAMDLRQAAADLRQRLVTLTPREREIFAAVAAGLLNKQIAANLGIAEKTVKVHRARVMEKMGAETLPDLVRMADLLGIRWRPATDEEEMMPGTGISARQERLASMAVSRLGALSQTAGFVTN